MDDKMERALDGVRSKIKEKLKRDDSKVSVSMHVPIKESHAEGEMWDDNDGKTWVIKEGKKIEINKYQGAKRPWWCPQCSKVMNHYLDDKMWSKKGMCFDCVIKVETKIRLAGKWEQYEKNTIFKNEMAWITDKIQEYKGYMNTVSQPAFVLESGELQKWNVNLDKVKEDLQKDLTKLQERYIALQKEVTEEDIFNDYARNDAEPRA